MLILSPEAWSVMTVNDLKEFNKLNKHKEKLSYDIQKIIPHVRNARTVSNICCGDGTHIKLLGQIYDFERIFVTDINQLFVFHVLMSTPLNFCEGYHYDLNETIPKEVGESDVVLWLNSVWQFEPRRILEVLRSVKSIVITAEFKSDNIWLADEMKKVFRKVKCERLYPNDLEDNPETPTYLLVGKN